MDASPAGIPEAAELLRASRRVVVFTGAGASAESGIPTFRDDDGFWREFPINQFATWRGLVRTALLRPRRVADFVHAVLEPIASASPNAGHLAVAELDSHRSVTVVTQNIDDLHQQAGSTTVHPIHGTLFEIVTLRGRRVGTLSRGRLGEIAASLDRARQSRLALLRTLVALRDIIGIGLRGPYRPNLVMFGDAMSEPAWSLALQACGGCDCMIQIGCSGVVMPAAMLPMEAKAAGASVITVDPVAGDGDVWLKGTAAAVMPKLVRVAFGEGEHTDAVAG